MASHLTAQLLGILLLSIIAASVPTKNTDRPVHEVINEQSRIDEQIKTGVTQGILPYGNPLAGNSQRNARLHAQNQQAMFNAERIRQHKAQLQRWTKAPPQVDSYMKAFQESQENHQLALEQQQSVQNKPTTVGLTATTVTPKLRAQNSRENIRSRGPKRTTIAVTTVTGPPPPKRRPLTSRSEVSRGSKVAKFPEPIKITTTDAITNKEKSRNHRSYGSVHYQQYLIPKRYQIVYVSPAPTYDQGVTIKPNGNIGLSQFKPLEELPKLYTEAIASNTKYVYPKQYSQMQEYQSSSSKDIDSLKALLNKDANEQVSQLSALINSGKDNSENKDTSDTPIDLYFYLKDPPTQSLTQQYEANSFASIPKQYASSYLSDATKLTKDHIPIEEEIDDVEDPRKNKIKAYGLQAILAAQTPQYETTTTKSNNYYKVEVSSEVISSGYKHPHSHVPQESVHQILHQESPYKSLQYGIKSHSPHSSYGHHDEKSDLSERYLHHNGQFMGIQHLSEDGTEVSAYGEDNLHYASNYDFGYRVHDRHTGNDFGHRESKNGGKTNGAYHVLLPDGRMQKVKYEAGPEGFHADISYDHLKH